MSDVLALPNDAVRRRSTAANLARYGFVALLAYVPLLLSHPGKVSADSKQYLFLDPGRLLERAPYLWHSEVHLGSVTHQNIGYLFPVGPFFWVFDRLGVPDWVAQRLWLGSILFFAALGVAFLLRTLRIPEPGPWVASLVYMLSPYTLAYGSRLSVLLLAWTALPWLLALTIVALRGGRWRAPAAFALMVQVAGSVNLTALAFVGIAPLLWIVWATFVTREVTRQRALATVGRIGVLTLATSVWWLVALQVQAKYGLNYLSYSETVKVVATGGHAGEVLRGLGNWFFYGGDRLGNWVEATLDYTRDQPLMIVGYTLAVLVFFAAATLRWRDRGFFVAIFVLGVLLAVGTHPYDHPSAFGAILKSFSASSSVGLALRNVSRATPLAVLGGSVLIGVAVSAYANRPLAGMKLAGGLLALVIVALAIVNLPPLTNGKIYGKNLLRPEDVPSYWQRAIAELDARGTQSRVLELPGSDFAAYTWGNAVEPITPGLTNRPYVARELIPYGSPSAASLLGALDRRLQMGLLEPESVAPIARLMSVGDIVLRSDLEVYRYDLARPKEVKAVFTPVPTGLQPPTTYGSDLDLRTLWLLDERSVGTAPSAATPAPIEIYRVDDPAPILRGRAGPGLIVSGDGDGLIDLAALGLLAKDPLIQYSAGLRSSRLRRVAGSDAVFVVTDTNRRRAQRWESIRDNVGYTERAGERSPNDPADHRLDVFPSSGDDTRTVTRQRGAQVSASAYGTRQTAYLPADRPARAADGDVHTAWRVGRSSAVDGEWLRIEPSRPVTADTINVVQPLDGDTGRFITQVRLRFSDHDGDPVGDDVLAFVGPESRTQEGQTIGFPLRTFARVDLVVEATNTNPEFVFFGQSPIGFAEVRIPNVAFDEVVRMPVDLVQDPAARELTHPLVYSMTRLRTRPAGPNISEEEPSLARSFAVPANRSFGVFGQARLSNMAPDDVVDRVLGYPGPEDGGIAARSSDRVRTTLAARASSAFDDDPATAWTTNFQNPVGQWIEVDTPTPVALDRLDLMVVADGRHSVPTRIRVDAGGDSRFVDVPNVVDGIYEGTTVTVPLEFAPLRGDRIRVTTEAIRPVIASASSSGAPVDAPVAIAEVGLPGVHRAAAPSTVPSLCRAGVLEIDGRDRSVQLAGSPEAVEAGAPLSLRACPDATEPAAAEEPGTVLGVGRHELRAVPGARTGIDLDRVVLASAAGGAPLVLDDRAAETLSGAAAGSESPRVHVRERKRTHLTADVRGVHGPFALVLGESLNNGWHATVNGRDLGPPQLVDGYANGWLVDPGSSTHVVVALDWTPQRRIWMALAVSGAAAVLCLVLILAGRRRTNLAATPPDTVVTLGSPFEPGSVAARGRTAALAAVGVGVFGAVVATPVVGAIAGALTALALLRPQMRGLLVVGAISTTAIAAVYVIVQQGNEDFPSVLDWPTYFDRVHFVAVAAVVFLAADLVVRLLIGPREEPPSSAARRGDDGAATKS